MRRSAATVRLSSVTVRVSPAPSVTAWANAMPPGWITPARTPATGDAGGVGNVHLHGQIGLGAWGRSVRTHGSASETAPVWLR